MFGRSSSRPIRVQVFAKTDLGKTRDHNEDRFLVADLTRGEASLQAAIRSHEVGERGSLFIVADGMGGAAAGELASEMATETIYGQMVRSWGQEPEATPQRFAYRLKEAVQLTRDQSLMQRLVEAGELTEEEAAKSERRNIILQALGPDARVKVDLTHQELRRGDILVLCSDGLSGQVKKEEIAAIASQEGDLRTACDRLIALANERGGPDNVTVVVARFDGDGLRPAEGDAEVGHQVYPLIDTETSTEPVPVYRGSPPPMPAARSRWRVVALLAAAAAAAVALYLANRSQ